jgi:hypothetical protein
VEALLEGWDGQSFRTLTLMGEEKKDYHLSAAAHSAVPDGVDTLAWHERGAFIPNSTTGDAAIGGTRGSDEGDGSVS